MIRAWALAKHSKVACPHSPCWANSGQNLGLHDMTHVPGTLVCSGQHAIWALLFFVLFVLLRPLHINCSNFLIEEFLINCNLQHYLILWSVLSISPLSHDSLFFSLSLFRWLLLPVCQPHMLHLIWKGGSISFDYGSYSDLILVYLTYKLPKWKLLYWL